MSTRSDTDHTITVDVQAAPGPPECVGREEVVAGYALQQRIGVGSYGEVWRAVGPGELPKAVKLLHGRYDGPTADAELKSLRLMREVRHPFLLNVERIEIVGSRLVIVTELAEKSLEERFSDLRSEGFKGIRRDELLKYLQDAADALDYMYDNHGLQHLDIKPGNLLLQGGHVKVADFGLIKNLNQTQASIIGGFTPLYAAPELFEGNPGRNSDQYSLAIVYQAMLTGVPPFSGRTAAQLTAQQLSSKPDLSPLSPADRSVIARALSKSPTARFPSCRGFVDRLSQRRSVKGRSQASGADKPPRIDSAGSEDELPGTKTELVAPKVKSAPLPEVHLDTSQAGYRPTLYLGLGGLGGNVLCRLRNRMRSRFGDGQPPEALPLLYVDTSLRATPGRHHDESGLGLESDETLAIPLRERQYYHSASKDLLEWLSRRWLYNIPRSQHIEGLRPLGRLAFVDHQQIIRERLRQKMEMATNQEAVERTAKSLGLPFTSEHPEVFIIASICGGTGGGAVLDAAYLVRDVLKSLGLEQSSISGLLLHATNRREQVGILQKVNTIACLKELELYCNADVGYPGDSACELPKSETPPFDHTYLVNMGDGISEIDFTAEADKVAEYVYRNTLTPARAFFSKCRISKQQEAEPQSNTLLLRTFGVATFDNRGSQDPCFEAASLDEQSGEKPPPDAASLCLALIRTCYRSLCVDGRQAVAPSVGEQTKALLHGLQLETNQLSEKALMISRGDMGDMGAYFQGKLTHLIKEHAGQTPDPASVCRRIDQEFTTTVSDDTPDGHPARTLAAVREQLARSTKQAVQAIRSNILSAESSTGHRMIAAGEAFSDVVFNLSETEVGLTKLQSTIEGDLESLHRRAADPSRADSEQAGKRSQNAASMTNEQQLETYLQHATLRCCSSVLLCLIDYVRNVRRATTETAEALRTKLAELEAWFREISEATAVPAMDHSGQSHDDAELDAPLDEAFVRCFDERLCCEHAVQLIDLLREPQSSDPQREGLPERLRQAALAFLREAPPSIGPNKSRTLVPSSGATELPDDVEPRLSEVGGGHRILVMRPEGGSVAEWKKALVNRFGECVSELSDSRSDYFLCCEVEGIKLDSAMAFLTGQNERIVEMASRNHTRIDVDWCQMD